MIDTTFDAAIEEAISREKLPPCCVEHGAPWWITDHFNGRARKFKCTCPEGHEFILRIWAPEGKRWPCPLTRAS